jgi:hypothetical protein
MEALKDLVEMLKDKSLLLNDLYPFSKGGFGVVPELMKAFEKRIESGLISDVRN